MVSSLHCRGSFKPTGPILSQGAAEYTLLALQPKCHLMLTPATHGIDQIPSPPLLPASNACPSSSRRRLGGTSGRAEGREGSSGEINVPDQRGKMKDEVTSLKAPQSLRGSDGSLDGTEKAGAPPLTVNVLVLSQIIFPPAMPTKPHGRAVRRQH